MLRIFKYLIFLLSMLSSVWANEGAVLRFGLFPNLEPRTLTMLYEPLRQHLEKSLGMPVHLYSTPDFLSFASRTQKNSYDLVLTAPHLAYLATQDAEYIPIAAYQRNFQTLLVVRKQAHPVTLQKLRGGTIAVPDPDALVTRVGADMLSHNGLPPADYHIVAKHGHEGAAMAVLAGDASAALVGTIPYYQLSGASRSDLQILLRSQSFPSQYFLVNKHVPVQQRKAILAALLGYNKTPAGQAMLESSGLKKVVADNGRALARLGSSAEPVRQKLQQLGNTYQ